jgi:NAD(P)-dependent dehydrogenase (short-subunit alcohol dehydrogenase family)
MEQKGRMSGKVALVTGAASGIGRATATLFAHHDATVICADQDQAGAETIATAIASAGGIASPVSLDVTVEIMWASLVDEIIARLGALDVLINSAGISFACPVTDTTLFDWRRVLAVNLDGVFLGTKHAIRVMGSRGGSIINVSSASGIKPTAGASAYAVSKAAVCMFTRAAAKECLERGLPIRINTVCPAGVKTPMWSSMPFFQELVAREGSEEGAFQALAAGSPGGRFAEPEEVAAAILYLASDESRFITGTDLVIDNGFTL